MLWGGNQTMLRTSIPAQSFLIGSGMKKANVLSLFLCVFYHGQKHLINMSFGVVKIHTIAGKAT